MKRKIIRLTAVFICVMLIAAFAVHSFAMVENRVYAEPVTVGNETVIEIPIKIENNSGFMGFAIIVGYDKDVFTPVSAEKGTTLSGMFNDSIEVAKDNSFKVVFSGTENCINDGILFTLKFSVDTEKAGEYNITLSPSIPDTFDENYNSVAFNSESIAVTVASDSPDTPTPADLKLSTKIENWYSSLNRILQYVLFIFVRPLVFILKLIGK